MYVKVTLHQVNDKLIVPAKTQNFSISIHFNSLLFNYHYYSKNTFLLHGQVNQDVMNVEGVHIHFTYNSVCLFLHFLV